MRLIIDNVVVNLSAGCRFVVSNIASADVVVVVAVVVADTHCICCRCIGRSDTGPFYPRNSLSPAPALKMDTTITCNTFPERS